ncbi:hypothetical protein AVEN_276-1 [Araneus ventricosus]|uniref:Uncharacterized protein n=1 Tax=Araneus ventricosus TaxID=182803 RepID=A0A4Y2CN04_ARAVE|nr:hypothetical protein AVEN_276-1 [Araneus ventricosus]
MALFMYEVSRVWPGCGGEFIFYFTSSENLINKDTPRGQHVTAETQLKDSCRMAESSKLKNPTGILILPVSAEREEAVSYLGKVPDDGCGHVQ